MSVQLPEVLDSKKVIAEAKTLVKTSSFSLAKIQILNVALINAENGRPVADQALLEIQQHLIDANSTMRLGRVSTSLYIAISKAEADPATFLYEIERARQEMNRISHFPFLIELAVGVVQIMPHANVSIDGWIQKANVAMLASSRHGQGVIYDEHIELDATLRLQLGRISQATELIEGLSWVYQPIVDAGTLKPVGVEVLVRWHHPSLGAISPETFIPIAENLGTIKYFDRWTMKRVAQDIDALRKLGINYVAINASVKSLESDSEYIDRLMHLVKVCEPIRVVVEITETAIMQSNTEIIDMVARIKLAGAQVAIDDFGEGSSNLQRLSQLPVDFLKLDKSLVRMNDIDVDNAMLAIGAQIGELIKCQTVAEGVETKEDLALIRAAGIDFAQGWLIGMPQPIAFYEDSANSN